MGDSGDGGRGVAAANGVCTVQFGFLKVRGSPDIERLAYSECDEDGIKSCGPRKRGAGGDA